METSKKGVPVLAEIEISHFLHKRINEVNKELATTKDFGISPI